MWLDRCLPPAPFSLFSLSILPQPAQPEPAHLPLFRSSWQFLSLCLKILLASLVKADQDAALGVFHFSSLSITHSAQWRPELGRRHNSKASCCPSDIYYMDHKPEKRDLKELDISLTKI